MDEIQEIWRRLGDGREISEHEFLTLAFWTYHAMPAENVRSAAFRLFMLAHSPTRPPAH